MKNTMTRMSALLLAMTCIPTTNLTATAVDLANPWWGSAYWDVFADLEPVDDRGMLTGTDGQLYIADGKDFCYLLKPQKTRMEFVLRDNVDADTAGNIMVQILDTYFPGIKDAQSPYFRNYYFTDEAKFSQREAKKFSFVCSELPENAKKIETKLLVEFAKHGLISEFYGWGEIAFYDTWHFSENVVEAYPQKRSIIHPEAAGTEDYITTEPVDWDAVQEYLNEAHPGYAVECYEPDQTNCFARTNPCYRINGVEKLTFKEKVELAGELYEKFGIQAPSLSPEAPAESSFGHNALEQPGDTNLDCEVNILDVIAANKHILGVGTLDKTGLKNADMDGNGTEDSADSLEILKTVLGITD